MDLSDELKGRTFRFERVNGDAIGILTLEPDGAVSGYENPNERRWTVENNHLMLRNASGEPTTLFNDISREGSRYLLRGRFLPRGPEPWHILREVEPSACGVIAELRTELYGGDDPFRYAGGEFVDHGYPHTNLLGDVVKSVLTVVRPQFWLELGTMLGGSAIRVAEVVKAISSPTEIVCVDPFTGDVNMWAWEQPKTRVGEWRFLALQRGRPTIYDRFLANVEAAGHGDIILPISATSIVGVKLLRRLFVEHRLSRLPEVIYLDSAHEPGETLLELQTCWELLEPGGVLMGDDWGWSAVRNDVLRFAETISINLELRQQLVDLHGRFTLEAGVLLDRGQWLLVK